MWNIDTSTAITQLIAHDREVYDVAWLPGSTDIFVSVGADGSLRAFDLRSLEHSTILYETPAPKSTAPSSTASPSTPRPPTSPLLRIAFNPADSNYMSTFHMDGPDIQILDMRSPGQPVIELRAHAAQINALAWGSVENPLLATAGASTQAVSRTMRNADRLIRLSRSLCRGRFATSFVGSSALHSTGSLAKKRRVSVKFAQTGCQEAGRYRPGDGLHRSRRDYQPGVVATDSGDDHEYGALDRTGRMDRCRIG